MVQSVSARYLYRIEAFFFFLGTFSGGPVVKSLPSNAGYSGSTPGLGRSYMPQGI